MVENAIKLISNEPVYFVNIFTFGLKVSLNFSLKTTPKSSADFGQFQKKNNNKKPSYRIISNISMVLNFFNVPPPRAIIGDVPLLETVPLLFYPHFIGMLPWPNSCQTHTFLCFFAGTDNEFRVRLVGTI